MDVSIVIGDPKSGKSYSLKRELKPFIGMKIGDKIRGELLDLSGYEFEISGGSDFAGFAMRRGIDVPKKKILVSGNGVGMKRKLHKGERRRITVAGAIVHEKIAQLNLKLIKSGNKTLEELFGKTESANESSEGSNDRK